MKLKLRKVRHSHVRCWFHHLVSPRVVITIIRKQVILLVQYCSWHGTEVKFRGLASFQQCSDLFITLVLLRLLGKIGNVVVILADKLHIRIQPDVDLDANMCEGGGGMGSCRTTPCLCWSWFYYLLVEEVTNLNNAWIIWSSASRDTGRGSDACSLCWSRSVVQNFYKA